MRSKKSRLSWASTLLAGVMAISIAPVATAQTSLDEEKPMSEEEKKAAAIKAYGEAQEKFDAGDYAGALPLYQKADALVPGVIPKYKAAQSLDKMGKAPEAVAAYETFLAEKPDAEKHQDKIDDANARIEQLKATPAQVKVAITPETVQNATILLDGQEQSGPDLTMPPGSHSVTVSAEGYESVTQEFEVTYGEVTQLNIALPEDPNAAVVPPPTPPPAPQEPAEERSLVPAYITLGLAGVGAVVGTIFGIQALGSKSDYDDNPTQESFDDAERNALIADMSFGVALTFGVTGVVLLLSGDDEATTGGGSSTTAGVAPYVGPDGGGAVGVIHF